MVVHFRFSETNSATNRESITILRSYRRSYSATRSRRIHCCSCRCSSRHSCCRSNQCKLHRSSPPSSSSQNRRLRRYPRAGTCRRFRHDRTDRLQKAPRRKNRRTKWKGRIAQSSSKFQLDTRSVGDWGASRGRIHTALGSRRKPSHRIEAAVRLRVRTRSMRIPCRMNGRTMGPAHRCSCPTGTSRRK